MGDKAWELQGDEEKAGGKIAFRQGDFKAYISAFFAFSPFPSLLSLPRLTSPFLFFPLPFLSPTIFHHLFTHTSRRPSPPPSPPSSPHTHNSLPPTSPHPHVRLPFPPPRFPRPPSRTLRDCPTPRHLTFLLRSLRTGVHRSSSSRSSPTY